MIQTKEQEDILASLKLAVQQSNLQEVRNIFKYNEDSNIQAALRREDSDKGAILNFVIDRPEASVNTKNVEIIKLIWQEANQKNS